MRAPGQTLVEGGLRVLQVNNSLEGAGAEVVMSTIGGYLRERGVLNAVATYGRHPRGEDGHYRIVCPGAILEGLSGRLPASQLSSAKAAPAFSDPNRTLAKRVSIDLRRYVPLDDPLTRCSSRRAYEDYRPDLVHFHKIMPSLSPLRAAAGMGLRTVITLHGYWPACPLGNLVRRDGSLCDSDTWSDCRRFCSRPGADISSHMCRVREQLVEKTGLIVAVSDFVRRRMIDFGYPAEMLATVHNGVQDFGAGTGVTVERNIVLFCGRLTTHKGAEVFIEAARLAKRRKLALEFVMVGALREARSLRQAVGDCIRVVPWLEREKLAGLMREALCIAIPSLWHEPLPIITLESMACGLPAIASRVGGIPEMVKDGDTGYLIDVRDRNEMARELVDRAAELAREPARREKMAASCVSRYREGFTSEIMGSRYLDTYASLT